MLISGSPDEKLQEVMAIESKQDNPEIVNTTKDKISMAAIFDEVIEDAEIVPETKDNATGATVNTETGEIKPVPSELELKIKACTKFSELKALENSVTPETKELFEARKAELNPVKPADESGKLKPNTEAGKLL